MLTYVVSISQWIETSERDILRAAKNRELWKFTATKILIELVPRERERGILSLSILSCSHLVLNKESVLYCS